MKFKFLLLIVPLGLSIFYSCSNNGADNTFSELNPTESFEEADAPEDMTYESLSFKSPWGYNKTDNSDRLYPLVVSGYWDEGSSYYSAVNQTYPAFLLSYQKNTESDGQSLAEWIQKAVEYGYRIDINRIYLTGFSMGGSGSFPLARGMYAEDMYFAAIIRVAGQSEPDLTNPIAAKTALWYHIGLSDTSVRIEVAQSALEYNRDYDCNSDAVETEYSDSFTGYERTTVKLKRSNYLMFLYSEYTGMGHDPSPCYKDENLFPWMFSHSLKYR